MSTWEERMAARHALRNRQLAEANAREGAERAETHLHGTAVACPCGAEFGITCVAFPEGWEQPDPCETCGKPVAAFCDCRASREVNMHAGGCPERPDTERCGGCGGPFLGVMLSHHSGCYHPQCTPGVVRAGE